MILVCAIGLFGLARFVPPPSPQNSAAAIAEIFAKHRNMTRFGLLLTIFGASFFGPWIAAISAQMRRIEGQQSPLAYAQLALGTCLIMEFAFPMMALQVAAYRPERPEQIILSWSDWGWMTFYGVTCTAVIQCIVIAIAIFNDRRTEPLFPRWVGYFNLWVALLFTPGTILVFFKNGPFAWNGLLTFWIPFAIFFAWMIVMTRQLFKSVDRPDPADDGPDGYRELHAQVELLTEGLAAVTTELTQLRAAYAKESL
jgi:hypothetical protein